MILSFRRSCNRNKTQDQVKENNLEIWETKISSVDWEGGEACGVGGERGPHAAPATTPGRPHLPPPPS